MNKKWVLALFAFILIINVSSVLAADFLSPIMNIGKGLDFGRYVNDPMYYPFIDAVIYFMLFISISMFALQKVFGDSKMVPITIGVLLALSMCGFEYYYKWRLMVALSMYAFILVILIVGFFLYYVMHRATNHFWVPFGITVFLVVGLITSNANVREQVEKYEAVQAGIGITQAIAFFGLIFSTKSLFKGKNDGPNAAETAGISKNFPKSKNAADNIDKVDKELESTITDKGEKELLEEAEEETKLEQDGLVIPSEAEETSEAVEKEEKAEEKRNNNEEQIMKTLIESSDMINNILNKAGDANVDKVLPEYIKKYLKQVSSVGLAIEQNQKIAIKERVELLTKILDNVKLIDDILDRTKRAESRLKYIENTVAKDMGQEVITHMKNVIDKLEKDKQRDTKGYYEMIKQAGNNGLEKERLRKEKESVVEKYTQSIRLMQINKAKVETSLKEFLKNYENAVTKTISDIQNTVQQQIDFEKKLSQRVNQAFSDVKIYDTHMINLQGAVEKIGSVYYHLEKEEAGMPMSDELINNSKMAIEGIFSQLSNINNLTLKLFKEDIKDILDRFRQLDVQSQELEKAISGLAISSEQVQIQYENIKKTASFNQEGQSANIVKILRAIDSMSKTSAQEKRQKIMETITRLNKTESELNNELSRIIQENERLNNIRDKIESSLKRALDTLMKIRVKDTDKISKASETFNATLAQQTQKLETNDAALKNIHM